MPYESLDDLPKGVKDHLPKHGQEIYQKAFNNALKEYGKEKNAHRVAWSAVEKVYHKDSHGKWVKN